MSSSRSEILTSSVGGPSSICVVLIRHRFQIGHTGLHIEVAEGQGLTFPMSAHKPAPTAYARAIDVS